MKLDESSAIPASMKNINTVKIDSSLESLQYSFLFTEPTLSDMKLLDSEYTKITMPGTITTGMSIGAPVMPLKIARFVLPPGRQLKSLTVGGDPIEINVKGIDLKQKPVLPYQKPVIIGSKLLRTIDIDTAIYTSQEIYPETTYTNQGIGYCRGYPILAVDLHPINYIPVQGKLSYYPEITVTLNLENTGYINTLYQNNPEDRDWVKTLVYNPEITELYGSSQKSTLGYPGGICDPSKHYDYVIITTTQNGLNDWQTSVTTPYNWTSLLTKHAIEDGLSGTLVTVQQIYAQPAYWNADPLFNDSQAKIREFCKDAYQDWGTKYVLIGGDDVTVPSRHMKYEYESDVDSDLYYSNLDNTFNANHDSYWGEEGDAGFDLYSELYVGRVTCDFPQDVSNWLKKSFYYTDATSKTYLDNAAFYGGALGWNAQGDDFIDYSAIKGTNNWLGPTPGAHGQYPSWLGFQYGFETWNAKNPGTGYDLSVKWTAESSLNPGWQGGSESAAVTGMRNAINNNQVTLISAVAHADATMSMDVGQTDWASLYTNTMPFFIHDYGCHCGDFDASDHGVLYTMLFNSDTRLAFACVYNTCYGWGSLDDTNSSSALQQKLFWDYLFDTTNNSGGVHNWQLGKAQAWSKDAMAPTIGWTDTGAPGSWRGIIQGCLLFGDPAQNLKPPIQPEHNVGVQSFDVSAHEPANTNIWVGTTLFNNGKNNETNVEVRFLVNDVQVNSTVIPFFAKNTVQTIGWWYQTPSFGWETLCVIVTMVPGENISLDNVRYQDVIYGPDIAVSEIQAPDNLGQGYAQQVQGYIQNLGPTNETVTIQFTANNTVMNSTSIYLTSGANTWMSFLWDGMQSGLGTYDVMIYAVPVPNEYYLVNQQKSHTVTVFTAKGNILLVDDDQGKTYETWYENALLAAQYVYVKWDRYTQPSPYPSTMQGYTAVVWLTGDDYGTTLDTTDESNLAIYLNNGGKLFISGQDLGYDINTDSFYANYLHATYNVDTAGHAIAGITGDVIGDGLSFSITGGDGANNQNYPDGIQPISPATTCFYYSDATSYKAGIKVDMGTYRIVYLAFGFEAIDNMASRTTVMSRSLGWLAAEHDIAVINLTVPTTLTQGEPTPVSATIINSGTHTETNIIVNFLINGGIQDTTTIGSLSAGLGTKVTFAWTPTMGTYIVEVRVSPVPGEQILFNNAMNKTVNVVIVQNDTGVIAINNPPETTYTGSCTVNASVRNFGDWSQNNVIVNCSIYQGINYAESFEASNGGYVSSGTAVWQWGTPTSGPGSAHSGTKLWATILSGNYPSSASAMLTSVSFSLPSVPCQLSFWQWYDTESYYDGGNVKISINNGTTWTILGSYQNPYPEDAAYSGNVGIPNEPCFSGVSNGWQKVTFDLSAYAGKTVFLRWHFGSDASLTYAGWYIDDVQITSGGAMLGSAPLYTSETSVILPAHTTRFIEFSPPWQATIGTYYIQVKTKLLGDENPSNDLLSKAFNVLANNPPNTPTIPSGRTKGIRNTSYTYTTSAIDPNGDNVYYLWDWGDGTNSSWLGPYPSGQNVTASHIWSTRGSYAVTVKAKDAFGAESSWSIPLTVNMYKLGDVNNDGWVSWRDIDPFVAAMNTLENDFETQHPGWIWIAADCNQDGYVTWRDIDLFVTLMNT